MKMNNNSRIPLKKVLSLFVALLLMISSMFVAVPTQAVEDSGAANVAGAKDQLSSFDPLTDDFFFIEDQLANPDLIPYEDVLLEPATGDFWVSAVGWWKSSPSTVAFSKDTAIKYSGSYSLKIASSDFADAHFRKQLTVEKNTIYRVSAMVRYEGYARNPSDLSDVGANISILGEWTRSEGHTGSAWKKLELEFNTRDRTSVDILLRNGFYSGSCKGTAWFSDVKIEKKDMTPSNGWNFLCLIIKNVDVTVPLPAPNGSNYRQRANYSQADVTAYTTVMQNLPVRFKELSNSMMTISSLDIVPVETTLTKITGRYGNGYMIIPEDIETILNPYLSQKKYDQIIVLSPLGLLADGWYGLGGTFYKNIGYAQVTIPQGGRPWLAVFPDAVYVHEVLHCLESRAYEIKGHGNVLGLHDVPSGYNGNNEWIEWYRDYMRNTIPSAPGKGLPKEVYTVYHGNFTTISTNMEIWVDVTGVTLNKSSTALLVGGTETLTATVAPATATDKGVTWSSSNTTAATVDQNGRITARAAGTATITVTTNQGSKKATCTVTVSMPTTTTTKPTTTTTTTRPTTTTTTTRPTTTTTTTTTTTITTTRPTTTTTTTTNRPTTSTVIAHPDYVVMRIDHLYAAVNGKKIRVNDTQELTPIFNDLGRTMVPFRFIATCFGAEVDWDEGAGSAIIDYQGKHIVLPIGASYAFVNGVQTPINIPAQIMTAGRTFVPFRVVSELLGGINLEYDTGTMTIVAADVPIEGQYGLAYYVAIYNSII